MSDHEYSCICDDLFDRIKSTRNDRNIMRRFISNEPNENESHSKATKIHNKKIQNKKRVITKKSTKHTLQMKGQKKLTIGGNNLITSG